MNTDACLPFKCQGFIQDLNLGEGYEGVSCKFKFCEGVSCKYLSITSFN